MITKVGGTANSLRFWHDWTSRIWQGKHREWQSRDGQDNYYRERVVFPAVADAVEKWVSDRSFALVDVGAGDGFTTSRLSMLLRDHGFDVRPIVMLDRSRCELAVARTRPELRKAVTRLCNLSSRRGAATLRRSVPQDATTVIVAVFVLQELPDLTPILSAVSATLSPGGIFLSIVVAPDFAEVLRRRGDVTVLHESSSSRFDWSWAGLYPIAVPSGVLHLPHFQYSRRKFRESFVKSGLRIRTTRELTLPNDRDARHVFGPTIYGDAILGRPSSLLIIATRGNKGRVETGGHDA